MLKNKLSNSIDWFIKNLFVRLVGYRLILWPVLGLSLFACLLFLGRIIVFAVPVSGLGASLIKVSDGTSPFPSIDPNGSNNQVATLDEARYRFDVNLNTLNGSTHSLTNITITAVISSTSPDVRWIRESLPGSCNVKTVSLDGKTLTCRINGPINTGNTLNIDAAWFAKTSVPNGTVVDTSFSVSATQSSVGALDQPVSASSSVSTLSVVSEPGSYEVRKVTPSSDPQSLNGKTIIRDSDGNPIAVRFKWGMQVETKSSGGSTVKGTSSIGFGDLSLVDNLASAPANQLPVTTKGTLVGCYPNNGGSSGTNQTSLSTPPVSFYANSVQNSGSWSCSQPGGTGSNINISASGIAWSPDWYPGVSSGNGFSTEQWSFNTAGVANDSYNVPSGQNNRAVVATQIVEIEYPYADLVAFNQKPGDQISLSSAVGFCNYIGSISVVGASNSDDPTNNSSCAALSIATSNSNGDGKFFVGTGQTNQTNGPETELGFSQGSLSQGQYDNYLAPGQQFGIMLKTGNRDTSIEGISNTVICDAFESNKYSLVDHLAPPNGGVPGGSHPWYSWQQTGTVAAGFSDIADGDIVVEFSSANSGAAWANYGAQRSFNCDSAGLNWVTDPSTHPNGLNNINLVRVRFLKPIAPGISVSTFLSVKAKDNLNVGDRLVNFMKYKSTQTTNGSWSIAGSSCDPTVADWNPLIGSFGCQLRADRAFVIAPSPYIIKSDSPASNNDITNTLSPASEWTYTLRSGLNWNANANINGVHVYDVLPVGMSFVSSSINPSLVVLDCDANINNDCLNNPASRTNYGQTTLVWDRGDYNFTHTNPDNNSATVNPSFFGEWTVTVKLASTLPHNTTLQNKSWVSADSGSQPVNLPLPFRTVFSGKSDSPANGPFDDDWVKVATAAAFSVDKSVLEDKAPFNDSVAEIGLNGIVKYDLSYANMSGGTARVMDAIDVLPYNGDNRLPQASLIDGSYTITKLQPVLNPSYINNIYITADDPSTINSDPFNPGNTAVGSPGRWKCTFSQRDSSGCPSSNSITAIRIISNSLTVGQWGTIRLELTTNNNNGGEWYSNSYSARVTGLALPANSSSVTVTTPCLGMGNRFFLDNNRDGVYSGGDTGIDDVDLELVGVGPDNVVGGGDDSVIKTTTTSGGGYYNFSCFVPGKYYVRVAQSERLAQGTIEGLLPGRLSEADPMNGVDDLVDHNLIDSNGTYRTNPVDMNFGNAPLDEPGLDLPLNMNDEDSNMTLDLAVERPFDVQLDKRVDGNNDSTYSKLEQLVVPGYSGNPDPTVFKYKFTVNVPEWADTSTGVIMTDIIRPGVTISSIDSVSQGSVSTTLPNTGASVTGSPLVWDIGTLNPGSSATLIVSANLTSSHLGGFATGFANGLSRNVAQITSMDQVDVDSTPNNVTSYDPVSHEDDESDASVTIPPIIGDRVWLDQDADGLQDPEEIGIPNVVVHLYKDVDGVVGKSSGDLLVGSQPTNVDGYWMFGGLDVGVPYYVVLDSNPLQENFVLTPGFQGADSLVDSNGSDGFISDLHSLTEGEINLGVDFGLHPYLSLGNSVFNDVNNNGQRDITDSRETGIPNVKVQLFSADDSSFTSVLQSTTTNSQGEYIFSNLVAGDYVVRIPDIAGDTLEQYTSTTHIDYEPAPDPNNNADNDDNGTISSVAVISHPISLGYSKEPIDDGDTDTYTNLSLDFGFVQFFSVGNRVFIDSNGNGVLDGSESGINDIVSLRLLNSDKSIYDSDLLTPGIQELATTTDSQGFYVFNNILAGDYIVEAKLPDGYRSTLDGVDIGTPNSSNNNTDRGLGMGLDVINSGVFTLGPNGDEPVDDEDVQTASNDLLLPDKNRNMTIDFGVVTPFDLIIDESLGSSSQTYATGLVKYDLKIENIGTGPTVGDVVLVNRLPSGLTYQYVESPNSNWSCLDNSNEVRCTRSAGSGNIIGGAADYLTIVARVNFGENNLNEYLSNAKILPSSSEYNDELIPLGSVNDGFESGDPHVDSNNDDAVSFNINNYSLGDRLFIDVNNNLVGDDLDWPIVGATITITSPGPDGDYSTVDDNITHTTNSDGDGSYIFNNLAYSQWRVSVSGLPEGVTNIYDVDGNKDNVSTALFSDSSILEDLNHDFGYTGNASLGDYVWWDTNDNGLEDSGELAMAGASIDLTWAGNDNDLSTTADNKILKTVTDSNGAYLFNNLVAGVYSIHVTPLTKESRLTTNNQDSLVVLKADQEWRDGDFGFNDGGVIGDRVYFDRNSNGKRDSDEPGIPGAKISLYIDKNGNGVIDSDDHFIKEEITNSDGIYQFTNLIVDDGISINDSGLENSATYLVSFSSIESSSVFYKYWSGLKQIVGDLGVDENGQNIYGYRVVLSNTNVSNKTADFGVFSEAANNDLYPNKNSTLSLTGTSIFGFLTLSLVVLITSRMLSKTYKKS